MIMVQMCVCKVLLIQINHAAHAMSSMMAIKYSCLECRKVKHLTNYQYAIEAAFRFDPEHPTPLLYDQNEAYKLIGGMFTAPAGLTENELNNRVSLSVAHWHHV
jgi:hypothetical protein